jgi:hypothetical protein
MSHNSQGFSCFVKVISTRFSEWNLTFHFSKQKLTEKLVRRGRFGDGSLSPKPSPLRTALSPNLAKKACTGQALSRPALYRLVNTGFYFFN